MQCVPPTRVLLQVRQSVHHIEVLPVRILRCVASAARSRGCRSRPLTAWNVVPSRARQGCFRGLLEKTLSASCHFKRLPLPCVCVSIVTLERAVLCALRCLFRATGNSSSSEFLVVFCACAALPEKTLRLSRCPFHTVLQDAMRLRFDSLSRLKRCRL